MSSLSGTVGGMELFGRQGTPEKQTQPHTTMWYEQRNERRKPTIDRVKPKTLGIKLLRVL
jgi:hypothetical protein